jgi:hypothetical protein
MVFDKSLTKTYMQVLYQGTYWLRQWAQLQRHEEHGLKTNENGQKSTSPIFTFIFF